MFVGHYGPSFAAKTVKPAIPLWVLFIPVQLLDVFWAIFVLLGIEKVRIAPGVTAVNPLDLYYMPYTHGLITSLLWSIAAAVVYRVVRKDADWTTAAIVGGAVFSHWILDLLVHRPDLPLYGDSFKVGLTLWDYPVVASALEVVIFFGSLFLYFRSTRPIAKSGRYGMLIFGIAMLVIQGIVFFGPPPASDKSAAMTALFVYFLFAGVASWLEKQRSA